MKKVCTVLLMAAMTAFAFGEKIGTIKNTAIPPRGLAISGKTVYVYDQERINMFDLDTLKFTGSFGKRGEGPGNWLFINPGSVVPHKDGLLVNAFSKIMFFSSSGKLLSETANTDRIASVNALGEFFVGAKALRAQGNRVKLTIDLYDRDLKFITQIYKQKAYARVNTISRKDPGKNTYYFPRVIYCLFTVYKDRLYVLDTSMGFCIAVFDKQGQKLYEIKKELPRLRVPQSKKQKFMEQVKNHPRLKPVAESLSFKFWDFYSPLTRISVVDGRIYAITNIKSGDDYEMMIMDLEGKVKKRVPVPSPQEYYFFTIRDKKFYYLKKSDKKEELELHYRAL